MREIVFHSMINREVGFHPIPESIDSKFTVIAFDAGIPLTPVQQEEVQKMLPPNSNPVIHNTGLGFVITVHPELCQDPIIQICNLYSSPIKRDIQEVIEIPVFFAGSHSKEVWLSDDGVVVNGDTVIASDKEILHDLGTLAEESLAIRQAEQLSRAFTLQNDILHYATPVTLAKQYASLHETITQQYHTLLANDMRNMIGLMQRWQSTLATLNMLSDYCQSVKDVQYGRLQTSIFIASALFTVLSAMNILLTLWLRTDISTFCKIGVTIFCVTALLIAYSLIRHQTRQRYYTNQDSER